MLTPDEVTATRMELQQNYKVLGYPKEQVCVQTHLTFQEVDAVLTMNNPNPSDVWTLRDYLEDMLAKEDKPLTPFSRLGDHNNNHWFSYKTPWRVNDTVQRPR